MQKWEERVYDRLEGRKEAKDNLNKLIQLIQFYDLGSFDPDIMILILE